MLQGPHRRQAPDASGAGKTGAHPVAPRGRGPTGPQLTEREELRRHVRTAAAGSRDLTEFFDRLERSGVWVRHRYSQQQPDQLTGYAVALPNSDQPDAEPVYFAGGKLGPRPHPPPAAEAVRPAPLKSGDDSHASEVGYQGRAGRASAWAEALPEDPATAVQARDHRSGPRQ
jgi:hypothetical protein